MLTGYSFPNRREENREQVWPVYQEKESLCTLEDSWRNASQDPPPNLTEVLATDGIRVKEAWVNSDGQWMRVDEKWERVFGYESKVTHWMPKPALPERRKLHEDRIDKHPTEMV